MIETIAMIVIGMGMGRREKIRSINMIGKNTDTYFLLG